MRIISRQFVTYGELLCFLLAWIVGLVVVFADGRVAELVPGNNLAATNSPTVGDFSNGHTALE